MSTRKNIGNEYDGDSEGIIFNFRVLLLIR